MFVVGPDQSIETCGAESRVVDVRRHRCSAVGRSNGAGDKPWPVRIASREFIRYTARQPCTSEVQLVNERFHFVIRHGNRVRVERVRLEDIGARLQVLAVDAFDHFGLRQIEEVIVTLQIGRMIFQVPTIARLVELEHLNHRAHRPVEDEDPPAK